MPCGTCKWFEGGAKTPTGKWKKQPGRCKWTTPVPPLPSVCADVSWPPNKLSAWPMENDDCPVWSVQ